jgi:hypothetical protein
MINNERPTLAFWPGVWSGRYTGAYVGNHGRDAFTVVQHSEWARDGNKSKSWKFGFRERVESCRKWIFLGPCSCSGETTAEEDQTWIDAYILSKGIGDGRVSGVLCKHPPVTALQEHQDLEKSEDLSPERVFCKKSRKNAGAPPLSVVSEPGDIDSENTERLYDSSTWFFFVTKTGAARWLALDGLAELSEIADYNYLLRGKDCCIACAVSQVTTRSLVLL